MRAYFYFATLLTVLSVLAAWRVPHFDELRVEKLPLTSFAPIALIAMAATGAVLASSPRSRGPFSRFIERHSKNAVVGHAAGAGAVLGWALGACIAVGTPHDPTELARMLVVLGYALMLGLAPLCVGSYSRRPRLSTRD